MNLHGDEFSGGVRGGRTGRPPRDAFLLFTKFQHPVIKVPGFLIRAMPKSFIDMQPAAGNSLTKREGSFRTDHTVIAARKNQRRAGNL